MIYSFIFSDTSVAKARQKIIPLFSQSFLFDISHDFTEALDEERFLPCEESLAQRERLLMDASDRQLSIVFRAPSVYMDGTFAKAPHHFT